MTYRVATEPASTILQSVNTTQYFGYFIRLLPSSCWLFVKAIIGALSPPVKRRKDVLVDGRDSLYIICSQREFPQKVLKMKNRRFAVVSVVIGMLVAPVLVFAHH